ncbi:hypothetical protein PM082_017693 [Marasmius tenuissimus]|nr:hypothetical protein PM082_017693 [Marasmius tenuissimus]
MVLNVYPFLSNPPFNSHRGIQKEKQDQQTFLPNLNEKRSPERPGNVSHSVDISDGTTCQGLGPWIY